ncbi:MAG: hypothetical protein ACI8ZM_003108 [Crocinitomix sp.]|jgi:hypothetical protein
MALEKISKTTLFQRIRRLVMGSEKPNLLTRVSVISGALVWFYLFVWQLMTFISTLLIGNVHESGTIRSAFYTLGNANYGLRDTVSSMKMHAMVQLIIYFIVLASLILIWRKRKIGFLIYVVGNITSLLITVLMLGWAYLLNEVPIFDFILITATTLYFSIGIFIFYRKGKSE